MYSLGKLPIAIGQVVLLWDRHTGGRMPHYGDSSRALEAQFAGWLVHRSLA